ncbi:MAG TPA: hypothetical protein DC045_07245, partial [Marinobacter adhaerens]|nr:hypothetical protein [Marinobacter adhaerens]
PVKLREQGYWKADMVRQVWNEHLSGREDYSFELWGILMFQAWLTKQGIWIGSGGKDEYAC